MSDQYLNVSFCLVHSVKCIHLNICNKSRSGDYSTQSLIIVSLTLPLATTLGSQSLAKTQGPRYVCITQRFI